jgi:hypothetical protein
MFADMGGVLDRLTQSTQVQAVQGRMYGSRLSTPLLEKMVNLQGLRAIYLDVCCRGWSILTKIRSLRTLTLSSSQLDLLDCSPFMKAFSQQVDFVPLQEWERSDSGQLFQLTKLSLATSVGEKPCDLLPLETRLATLVTPFGKPLLDVLPRCRSIFSLEINSIRSNDEIASLSEALLLVPFIRSLTLDAAQDCRPNLSFSSLPLSSLQSFKLASFCSATKSLSAALATSKPKSLTTLEFADFIEKTDPLARALLECPSLTHLAITERYKYNRYVLQPFLEILPRLPLMLTKLVLSFYKFTDESIQCLLSFLSRSAVQDLTVGVLGPKHLQLLADTLPSLSRLQTLEFSTPDFCLAEHDSSHLALFTALTSSSLRSLTLCFCSFRLSTFEACLNKIPETQLTRFVAPFARVYADGFDEKIHDLTYKTVRLDTLIDRDWNTRFPLIKDRLCLFPGDQHAII